LANGDLGWYMDLVNTQADGDGNATNTDNLGERQVSDPILRGGRILFTTLIPSDDPCDFGGTGWLMEMDADTGGALSQPPFDLNRDGDYDDDDVVNDVNGNDGGTGGAKLEDGAANSPGIASDEDDEYKYLGNSSGNVGVIRNNPMNEYGRQSWNRLDK
jgi:type IV pilus assembly protein PilY1